MKKKVFIFLLNLSLLLILLPQVNTQTITGETFTGEAVTGEATSSNVAISITLSGLPFLSLLNPENKTYLSNESILLNFSVSSEDFIWYNLDSGSNITITSSTFINVSQGAHTLNLYANNSQGEKTKNVSFTANSTKFIIVYSKYFGSNKGSSTDFNASTYEDLSNIILENTLSGKITFNIALNLTNDSDFSDKILDLDTNTNISSNRIELNSTALQNFNKSATLILYGLSFSNPRILRDGSVCPSSICTENSFSGGNFSFNVTSFTVYSTEETPVDDTIPSPSGGGGKVKKAEPIFFKVTPELIKIQLKIGERLSLPLKISSNHTTSLNFSIESNLNKLLSFSETNFSIEKGQSKDILLSFHAKEDLEPGVYSGKITIKTKGVIKEILLIIEVKTKKIIFDVSLNILSKYKEIFSGEKLVFQITIFNLGEVEEAEVLVSYFIKDFEGKTLFSQEEKITIGDQASFSKTIKTPKNMKPGDYVLSTQTRYDGTVGTASEIFRIKVEENFLDKYLYYMVFTLIAFIILFIIIVISKREHGKLKKSISLYKKKIKGKSRRIKEKQRESIKKAQRLKRIREKISVLEKAYAGGYISKESYKKSKKRIKNLFK